MTDLSGEPLTRTVPSTSSRSSRVGLELLGGRVEQLLAHVAAAAITARPLLNVVCEPHEPMSQGPASVSW